MSFKITLKRQFAGLFLLIAYGLSAQTITTVAPSSVTQRSAMTVTGTGFTSTSTVRFYTTADSSTTGTYVSATSVTFVSSTQLTVIVPIVTAAGSGSATRAIRVYNGTTPSAASTYTYVAPATTPAGAGITQLVTNYGGSWVSSTTSLNATQPDTGHSVVGFKYGGVLYSSGSESAVTSVLNTAGFTSGNGATAGQFTPGNFRALPIKNITGTVPALNSTNPCLIVLGSKTDGSSTAAVPTAPTVTGLSVRDVLIDGLRGLGIGTGVTNLPSTSVLTFQAGTIVSDNTVLTDAIPDILVTQIATPSTEYSVYCFVDSSGNIVGNPVQVAFTSVSILGTYKVDFFTMTAGMALDAATVSGWTTIGANTRDIRMVGYKLSDFGITSANKAQAATFKVMPSGTSDPAFMCYNRDSFSIPAPEITAQPTSQAICPGGTATFNISVSVSGTEVIYQWEKNGVALNNGATGTGSTISGATTATLQIANLTASDAGVYRCLVTNTAGAAFSNSAFLNTVILSATGTTGCVNTGTNTTKYVEAGAQGINLAYQWYDNGTTNSNTGGTLITGATSSTYYPSMSTIGTKYYYAKVYNTGTSTAQCTAVFTSAVAATVTATANAGTVSANQSICSGTSAIVSTSGYTGTLQWQESASASGPWANVTTGSGGTTQTYTTPTLTAAHYYRVIATSGNGDCTATSGVIAVTIATVAVWEGDVSNDWNTAGNWACGVVPTLTTDAQIPVVSNPNVYPRITGATGNADVRNVTINAGANIAVVNAGLGIFRIAGTLNNNGVFDAQDGTVVFMGTTGAQAVGGDSFYNKYVRNLTINNTNGFTLAGELNLTGILTVTAGQFTTGNQLTLKSNAATTAMVAPMTGSISGTMVIERYIPARRAFRLISSPVNGSSIYSNWQEGGSESITGWGTDITGPGGTANGFDVSGSNNPSLFTFDNTGGTSWNTVGSTLTNNLTAGQPLRILIRGDRSINQQSNFAVPTVTTLRSAGSIKTGDVTVNNLSQVAGKYSFVGNPYQAPVNMNSVMAGATNINTGFYYFWDPTLGGVPTVGQSGGRGAYVTVLLPGGTNTSGSAATQYIQPNQAFFVQTLADGPASLQFKESYKTLLTNVTPTVYSTETDAAPARIWLKMYDQASFQQNDTPSDGLIIDFSDEYSNDIDAMDAPKMGNQDENVATLNGTDRFSVERRATPTLTDAIQLFNNQYRKSAYTYAVNVTGMENGLTAYLHDKFNDTVTELANGDETLYNFTVDADNALSVAENRFEVVFQVTELGNEDFDSASFKVYPNPSTGSSFFVEMPSMGEKTTVAIYNIVGQQVSASVSAESGNTVKVTPATVLSDGVYTLKINNGQKTVTKKLIIK